MQLCVMHKTLSPREIFIDASLHANIDTPSKRLAWRMRAMALMQYIQLVREDTVCHLDHPIPVVPFGDRICVDTPHGALFVLAARSARVSAITITQPHAPGPKLAPHHGTYTGLLRLFVGHLCPTIAERKKTPQIESIGRLRALLVLVEQIPSARGFPSASWRKVLRISEPALMLLALDSDTRSRLAAEDDDSALWKRLLNQRGGLRITEMSSLLMTPASLRPNLLDSWIHNTEYAQLHLPPSDPRCASDVIIDSTSTYGIATAIRAVPREQNESLSPLEPIPSDDLAGTTTFPVDMSMVAQWCDHPDRHALRNAAATLLCEMAGKVPVSPDVDVDWRSRLLRFVKSGGDGWKQPPYTQ
ncbi:MAG: hypothetical protein EA401_00130 [Planctomycetota bacterium]|nr:MAG: hypothetical protein EA401_00130 [Planctomycetota bacterium]